MRCRFCGREMLDMGSYYECPWCIRSESKPDSYGVNTQFQPYRSCNCFSCRHKSSKAKSDQKSEAHRRFRRQSKLWLQELEEETPIISCGR